MFSASMGRVSAWSSAASASVGAPVDGRCGNRYLPNLGQRAGESTSLAPPLSPASPSATLETKQTNAHQAKKPFQLLHHCLLLSNEPVGLFVAAAASGACEHKLYHRKSLPLSQPLWLTVAFKAASAGSATRVLATSFCSGACAAWGFSSGGLPSSVSSASSPSSGSEFSASSSSGSESAAETAVAS